MRLSTGAAAGPAPDSFEKATVETPGVSMHRRGTYMVNRELTFPAQHVSPPTEGGSPAAPGAAALLQTSTRPRLRTFDEPEMTHCGENITPRRTRARAQAGEQE